MMEGNPKFPYLAAAVFKFLMDNDWQVRPKSVRGWCDEITSDLYDKVDRHSELEFASVISYRDFEDLFSELSSRGIAVPISDPNTAPYWEIPDSSSSESVEEITEYVTRYGKLGAEWLYEALENLTEKQTVTATASIPIDSTSSAVSKTEIPVDWMSVPASDRFVSFDHNDPSFKEMQSAVEEAAGVIPKSNQWEGEDKEAVLEHLSLGRQLLKSKNKKIAAGAISALLLAPLYAAYVAIAEETFRDLIMAAIKAVGTYFGI